MSEFCPKKVLRDVLIGFSVGLAVLVSVGVVTTAFANTSALPPPASHR